MKTNEKTAQIATWIFEMLLVACVFAFGVLMFKYLCDMYAGEKFELTNLIYYVLSGLIVYTGWKVIKMFAN